MHWSLMSRGERDGMIAAAAGEFPATFGLRAFPRDVFRVSLRDSYVNDEGEVMLYTQRRDERGQWLSFTKGSVLELKREATELARPERMYPITVYVSRLGASAKVYGDNERKPAVLSGQRILGVYDDAAALGKALIEWAEGEWVEVGR